MTRISAYASPLIGQTVGGDIDPDILARASLIQQGQQNGLIPTMETPGTPTAISIEPFQGYHDEGQIIETFPALVGRIEPVEQGTVPVHPCIGALHGIPLII